MHAYIHAFQWLTIFLDPPPPKVWVRSPPMENNERAACYAENDHEHTDKQTKDRTCVEFPGICTHIRISFHTHYNTNDLRYCPVYKEFSSAESNCVGRTCSRSQYSNCLERGSNPQGRPVGYVHCVMHKCIMVKVVGETGKWRIFWNRGKIEIAKIGGKFEICGQC